MQMKTILITGGLGFIGSNFVDYLIELKPDQNLLILDKKTYYFEGAVEGEILTKKTGDEGFGYDPLFKPKGFEHSFAQMGIDQKNQISHRGIAVRKLVEFLNNKQ